MVMDYRIPGAKLYQRREVLKPKIRWNKIYSRTESYATQVCEEKMITGDSNQRWTWLSRKMKDTAKYLLGESRGGRRSDKETWWWSTDVQALIKEKKKLYKIWRKSKNVKDKELYVKAKRDSKRCVAKAKTNVYENINERLGTKERENMIYKIAKSSAKDITVPRIIKDKFGGYVKAKRFCKYGANISVIC